MRVMCLLALGMCACIPVCETKVTRCDGSHVEICDSNGRWQEVMDCAEVAGFDDGGWVCTMEEGEHFCLPAEEVR